jgi:hypothetical protein
LGESTAFAVGCKVGRLVEARLYLPRAPQQIADFADALRRTFLSLRGSCVICADWRSSNLLAPPVADRLVDLLRRGNPHVERSAVLLPSENAVFSLQVERVIREAGNHARRAFRNPHAMRAWLSEVLAPAEIRRLDEFLLE